MAQITIDYNQLTKASYTYNLRNIDTINLINFESVPGKVSKLTAQNSSLTVLLTNGKKLVFSNISNPDAIRFAGDYTKNLQEFYDENYDTTWVPANKVIRNITGTFFGEDIDVHTYNFYKNGITINAGAGNDTVIGTDFADTISGGDGNDILTGGKGNDKLTGGKGSDKFVFSSTDGVDTVSDADNNDKIQIKNVNKENLTFGKNGNNLEIFYDNSFDDNNKIIVTGYFTKNSALRVNEIIAKNGTIKISEQTIYTKGSGSITGSAGNDTIIGSNKADMINAGAGNDVIFNSKGNDRLTGGAGSNTYFYSTADFGTDTITLTRGEKATIDLSGLNLNASDVTYSIERANLKLTTDKGIILLANFAQTDVTTALGDVIVKYKDGTSENLRTKNFEVTATANYTGNWHDETIKAGAVSRGLTLSGGKGNDKITGSSFADTITGGDGNDILTGGKGNDKLTGGIGSDKFVFSWADGVDTVSDADINDKIQITDVNKENLTFGKNGNNLEIFYDNSFDDNNKIIVTGYFTKNAAMRVNEIIAKNGTIKISEQTIYTKGSGSITGSAGNDTIIGSDKADMINAGAGNDFIFNSKGNDRLTGGAGSNTYYYSTAGFGTDTITLTRGEKATIDLSGLNINASDVTYSIERANLKLTTNKGTILLANFAQTDVTTALGDVIVKYKDGTSENLRTKNFEVTATANYTGNWHDETIKAGAVSRGITINGGAGNDEITGSYFADTISGGDGNDILIGGKGNDKLTGGKGSDKFVFALNDGIDTISDADNTDKIQFTNVKKEDLTFVKNGNNLEIFYDNTFDENNKVIVTGYFTKNAALRVNELITQNGTIKISEQSIYTKGSGNIKGTFGNDTIIGSDKADTINTFTGNDTIYAGGGNDTIIGGKGNDILYGGAGANTFVFDPGDGNDTIMDAKSTDILQFNSKKEFTFAQNDFDLLINYGTDSVTINDYFGTTNRIDIIKVKNGTKFENISIKEKLEEQSEGKTLVINENAGNISVEKEQGYETLRFVGLTNPEYLHYNISGDGNDLIIDKGTTKVTLTDYMKGGHSVKQFEAARILYNIPYHAGTDGNDVFNAQNTQEFFFLKGGNDTINFKGKDFTAYNTIYSDGTSQNTTTITFDNYSLEDEQLRFEYFANGGGYNKLDIYAKKEEAGVNHYAQVSYDYYFSDNKPTVTVKDSKNAVYTIDKVTNATTLNWLSTSEANKNHVTFLLNSTGKNTVISNTKTNLIYSNNGGNLEYTYKGGIDKVNSDRYDANDIYNVNSFNSNTRLIITDKGGNDTVNINTIKDKLRLFFDVESVPDGEGGYIYREKYETSLVYSDTANIDKLVEYFNNNNFYGNNTVDGVVTILSSKYDEAAQKTVSGIETVTATDGVINIDAWKAEIAQNICGWFASQHFDGNSLSEAIINGELNNSQLQTLTAYFNTSYNNAVG